MILINLVFEVSPKEIFAVAGCIGYLSVFSNTLLLKKIIGGKFTSALVLYLAYLIYTPSVIIIAICLALLFPISQTIGFIFHKRTPLEMHHKNNKDGVFFLKKYLLKVS